MCLIMVSEKPVCSSTFVLMPVSYTHLDVYKRQLKDIEVKKAEFEKWGRTIVLLFTDEAAYKKFDRKEFPNLPSNVVFGIDKDGSILKMIAENMKLGSKPTLPVIILGDTFNRVVFESHGYTIGMGEQLLHVIHGL